MSYTKEVPCPHCNGEGEVVDYSAQDIVYGSNEVPEHTRKIVCHVCNGNRTIRVNPEVTDV